MAFNVRRIFWNADMMPGSDREDKSHLLRSAGQAEDLDPWCIPELLCQSCFYSSWSITPDSAEPQQSGFSYIQPSAVPLR